MAIATPRPVYPRWRKPTRQQPEPKTRAALNGVPLLSAERASRVLHRWGAMFPVVRPGESGWVYVAWRRGTRVKVGWSRDPARRIAQVEDGFYLQGEATPLVIVGPCHRKAEYVFLRALERFRLRNAHFPRQLHQELLRPDRDLLELVALLRAAAESCFFDNTLAPYAPGPAKKCVECKRGGHNRSTCLALAPQRAEYARRAIKALVAARKVA